MTPALTRATLPGHVRALPRTGRRPRHFADYTLLRRTLDALLANRLPAVLILYTGGRGTSCLACSYALARRLMTATIPTDWGDPGGSGRRNGSLVASADAVVVFDDGKCSDTLDVLGRAVKLGKPLRVIEVAAPNSGRAFNPRWG